MKRLAMAVVLAALGVSALAQAPLDTTFSYQGKLTQAGTAPTGLYDLQFLLYDAAAGGSQVGPTVSRDDVMVTAGLFTVTLDFGPAFAGSKRFLEIGVRPGASTGAYAPLSPRQELTASPNALFSLSALELTGFRTLVRAHGQGPNDGTDSGALASRLVIFDKKRPDTALRVTYTDNVRVLQNNMAGRWEIRFDGASCANPGGLVYDVYNGTTGFMHLPVTLTGTCHGLGAGSHTLQVYVGPSPAYPVNDLFTGWNSQYWALEVEEVR